MTRHDVESAVVEAQAMLEEWAQEFDESYNRPNLVSGMALAVLLGLADKRQMFYHRDQFMTTTTEGENNYGFPTTI